MKAYHNTLVLDIETVSAYSSYQEIPEKLRLLWDKKSSTLKNDEEFSAEDFYFKKAGIYAEFGKIICISVGYFHQEEGEWKFRVKSLASKNELEVLHSFVELLNHFDQKKLRLVAHNGKEFDFPYICRRMMVNGIEIPEALNLQGKKPWDVLHIDTMELWKFGDRKNFTSLELLAALFDIPSPKEDIDGSMVNEVFYLDDDLERISTYCKNDVIVTAQLLLKFNNLSLLAPENIILL